MLKFFFIGFSLSFIVQANSAWIIGPEEIIFINSNHHQFSVAQSSVKSSSVDPETCHLWYQSGNQLIEINPEFQVIHQEISADEILGDRLLVGGWISFNKDIWTLRDRHGQVKSQFPAPLSSPTGLVFLNPNTFWTLDFQPETNFLGLSAFDLHGNNLASYPISTKTELWLRPFLVSPPEAQDIWIGYTAGTSSHSYSPLLEQWSGEGQLLNKQSFSHRGLLLGMALTPRDTVIIARDVPSDPFTAPLYTFIDEINHFFDLISLFSLEDNYISRSLDSHGSSIWTYEQSILGGAKHKIVKRDFFSSQEKVFTIKESAWKIHACSVQ